MESIPGDEHRIKKAYRGGSRSSTIARYVPMLAIAAVCSALSFWGGVAYQKQQAKTTQPTVANQAQSFGGPMGGRMMMRGGLGEVTVVSSTAISVQQARSGSTTTYKISNETTVSSNGSSAKVSDIKVGDTVIIRTDGVATDTATEIILNPQTSDAGPSLRGNPPNDSQLQTQ